MYKIFKFIFFLFIRYFYNNRLTSAPQNVQLCRDFPLHPYRVFHLNCLQSNTDMTGFCNTEEADFICTMLKVMTKHAKPENYSYGIITPYAKQRMEIQTRLSYVEKIYWLSFTFSIHKFCFIVFFHFFLW